MTGRAFFILTLLLSGIPGIASAQNLQTNFFAGALGSYEDYSADVVIDGVTIASDSMSGGAGGVFAGFGLTDRGWYMSVEGEMMFGGAKSAVDAIIDGVPFSASVEADRSFGIGTRYGYIVGGNFLVYARVGWTQTRFKTVVDFPPLLLEAKKSINGLAYGGGIEWFLSSLLSLRVEYIYTDYKAILGGLVNPSRDVIRGGIAVRF